jgi:hypothetical protein
MKKLKWLSILLSLVFCSVALAQAPDFEKITDTFYKQTFKEKKAIDSWTEGLKRELDITLSKIEVGFKQQGSQAVQGGTVIGGTLRIKIFGYKGNNKVHVIVERTILVFIDETNTIIDSRLLSQEVSKVMPGWEGIET